MQSVKNSLWAYALWMQIALKVSLAKHLRIIDGWNDDAGDYPYVVRLESNETRIEGMDFHVICTGTLLTHEWVLTASHCIAPELKIVRYGDMTVPHKKANTSYILKKIIHPQYRLHTWIIKNDIGLLLIEAIHMEATGKLSSLDYTALVGKKVTTAGYGDATPDPTSSDNIEMEKRPLQIGEGLIFETMDEQLKPILAVAPKCMKSMHGIHSGDSGGPLFVSGKVVGVTCASIIPTATVPNVQYFTPVSPYLDWIVDIIHKEKKH